MDALYPPNGDTLKARLELKSTMLDCSHSALVSCTGLSVLYSGIIDEDKFFESSFRER